MFTKSIRTILAAGIVATGAAVSTTGTANAGGNFGVYIGGGHHGGGIYFGNGGHGYQGGHHGGAYSGHGGHAYHGGHHSKRRHCGPRRALNKAYRIGVYKPHVARINHKKIVVKGYSDGYLAKVVFKRTSHGCKIIKTRGLY